MKLREIASDSFSLEFAPYGLDAVMTRLAAFGALKVDRQATYDRIHIDVGGSDIELLYLDEWDEPCLISSTSAGNILLRSVAVPTSTADGIKAEEQGSTETLSWRFGARRKQRD